MVDDLNKRLDGLRAHHGLSFAKFGEIAGVSAQAAHKWSKGGKIDDPTLRKITDHFGLDFIQFKYGPTGDDANAVILGDTNFLQRLGKLYKEYEAMPIDKKELVDEALKQQAELRKLLDAKRKDDQ